jgi:5,10-methenyltetrahydrofolate synthetase
MGERKSETEVDGEGNAGHAFPPRFMHEIDPAYSGLDLDTVSAQGVMRWRNTQRERLIAARLALSSAEREQHARRVARDLDILIRAEPETIVSVYWPFRGEPNLRPWMAAARAKGLRIALPVVVAKGQPLVFHEWEPGARVERGVWNIPFPADGAAVVPTVLIAPLVGFDPAGYRLGYGGGFFDRTLAALNQRPLAIGVGHPVGAIPTIYPQPHDIPMDWIVTGCASPKVRTTDSRTER